jgi:hypothetical protein
MNQPSYHNTTNAGVQLVIDFESKAKAQEKAILMGMLSIRYNGSYAGPSEIHDFLIKFGFIDKHTPLTSIRRAITNLTKKGYLRKTNIKVTGKYGRQEYCWERTT